MWRISDFLEVEGKRTMREVLFHMVIFVLLLTILEPNYAFNTLKSVPTVENGILTTCTGNPIAITCSHNETLSRSTTWNFSPPVNCSTIITHREDDSVVPPCYSSMIMFQDVESVATSGTTIFRSTALVNATAMMSGSVVECRGGNRIQSVNIGNITLCVIGQLPPPADLQCMNTPNGLMITWNNVTDTSCAGSPVKYNVTVVRQNDGMVIDLLTDLDGNGIEILNKTSPSIDYRVSISARTTIARCDGEKASAICNTSAADHHLFIEHAAPDVSSTVAAVVVVVVIITTVTGAFIAVVAMFYRHKHNKSNIINTERARVQNSAPSYVEVLEPEADLEIATQQNAAYLDIKSTRLNCSAGASVSVARSALDATSEGHLYAEIPEADDKLSEIPVNQNVAYLDLKYVNKF